MKFIIVISLSLFSLSALAESEGQRILTHPVVQALETLLNQTQGGACTVPTKDYEIQWRCTGAIAPVTAPRIDRTGCGFSFVVKCPGKTMTVYGTTKSYFLNVPKDTPHTVVSVDGGFSIDSVLFQ